MSNYSAWGSATPTALTGGSATLSSAAQSSTTPNMDGTATIGSTGTWADGGHIHPTDTSRLATGGTAANSSQLLGNTWAAPGTIGATTAGIAWFTTCNASTAYKVGGTQVLGSQQAGLGATLASTHCGATYTTTEQGLINALIDKIVLLETKLKAHGLVAT